MILAVVKTSHKSHQRARIASVCGNLYRVSSSLRTTYTLAYMKLLIINHAY